MIENGFGPSHGCTLKRLDKFNQRTVGPWYEYVDTLMETSTPSHEVIDASGTGSTPISTIGAHITSYARRGGQSVWPELQTLAKKGLTSPNSLNVPCSMKESRTSDRTSLHWNRSGKLDLDEADSITRLDPRMLAF